MMGDGAHAADMQLFHQLCAHRSEITRNVVMRPDGIATVTESMIQMLHGCCRLMLRRCSHA